MYSLSVIRNVISAFAGSNSLTFFQEKDKEQVNACSEVKRE